MSIYLTLSFGNEESWIERLRQHLPGRRIVRDGEAFDPADVSYAVTWNHKHGRLNDFPDLRAIFSIGAGVDHVFSDPNLPDVPVVRIVDPNLTQRMGEWVLLHVLLHHRQQRMYDWQQYEKLWTHDSDQPAAAEVSVGVMGLGELGADCARKLGMVGFEVAGWSRSPKKIEDVACFSGDDELDAFLARTEILVCLLPLTSRTRGILNRQLFSKLARDGRLGPPILINGARGGLQVEEDIIAALDDGTLKAATLDVFETEPLPPESPLWHHPGITITPHNAAISEPDAIVRGIARQIAALEKGEALENVVDPKLQY